ncbi:hypothetical protein UFOVP253_45 [uncultured Caudovirales phage]|uniref:Uncharacterized protein n=1 Tax=uncultured Caudovirales phage TaxID=2100421 RepID=A0A6J5LGI5_9CAUD|nr:hypothetical protein UFOVP253_45 [uncultured Caudovirales phage]
MATTPVTINIDSTLIATAATALCWQAGLPVSNANAKQAIINYTMNCIANYQAQQAQALVVPPASNLIT